MHRRGAVRGLELRLSYWKADFDEPTAGSAASCDSRFGQKRATRPGRGRAPSRRARSKVTSRCLLLDAGAPSHGWATAATVTVAARVGITTDHKSVSVRSVNVVPVPAGALSQTISPESSVSVNTSDALPPLP